MDELVARSGDGDIEFVLSWLPRRPRAAASAAVEAWRTRNTHDRLKVIEAATGYPPELVAEIESAFI